MLYTLIIIYLFVSWCLGLFFVLATQDEHISGKTLFLNKNNLFYILCVFPLISWALLTAMLTFYILITCVNILERVGAFFDK